MNIRNIAFKLIIFALVTAIAAFSTIVFVVDRLDRGLKQNTQQLLGADLVIESVLPWSQQIIDVATAQHLQTSVSANFPSMVFANATLRLASVRAVDAHYPLYGSLQVKAAETAPVTPQQSPPQPGTVLIAAPLAQELGVKQNSMVDVGASSLRVAGLLQDEPEGSDGFQALAPRLLMRASDLVNTQIIRPGSRVDYQLHLKGSAQQIAQFRKAVASLLPPGAKFRSREDFSPPLARAFDRVQRYFNMVAFVSLILASIIVVISAEHYMRAQIDRVALLRTFGAQRRRIIVDYLKLFAWLGLVVGAIASAFGWGLHLILLEIFKNYLPVQLPPPGIWPFVLAILVALIILAGFALPRLWPLLHISPLQIFRHEAEVVSMPLTVSYVFAVVALGGLGWLFTGSYSLAFVMLQNITIMAMLFLVVGWLIAIAAQRLRVYFRANMRLALMNLSRHAGLNAIHIMATALTVTLLLVLIFLRQDLIHEWQATLPEKTPNYFIINISPVDVAPLQSAIHTKGITGAHFYPTVRGRIIAINGHAVSETDYPGGKVPESLTRTLNLSWATELPIDNKVIAGRWWQPADQGQALISLESGMAKSLGVKLGDNLTFAIAERSLQAKVISLRELHWEDFQPNFYVIFPPKVLDDFQASVMTSLYVPPHSELFLNQLRAEFPDITFIDVDFILNKVRDIYKQALMAVNFLSLFIWVLCAQSLFTALLISQRERQYDGMVLRALGMRTRQFRRALLLEYLITGLIASGLGVLAATLLQRSLATVTKIPIGFNAVAVLAVVVFACGIHIMFALFGQRKILSRSPAALLRGL